jgi:hypothetical protein
VTRSGHDWDFDAHYETVCTEDECLGRTVKVKVSKAVDAGVSAYLWDDRVKLASSIDLPGIVAWPSGKGASP